METRHNIRAAFLLLLFGAVCVYAKDPKKSDILRDGSSEKRAILVPVPEAKSHEWQIAYLKKHFPEHFSFEGPISNMNEEHAFIAHEKEGKYFDCYSWTIGGRKTEVYFDITKQVEEFTRANEKPK